MLAQASQHAGGRLRHVLVVESNRRDRVALARALSDSGYVVDTAFPGREALRQLASVPYDAVLLDIHLPGGFGLEALRCIRNLASDTGIIVITGSASFSNAVTALRAGVSDYILKPADPPAVLAALRRLDARRSHRRPHQQILERACRAVRDCVPPGPSRRAVGAAEHRLVVPPLMLDGATGEAAVVSGHERVRYVGLSDGEARLLARLMTGCGEVWSCSQLAAALSQAHGNVPAAADLVRPIISRLRARLGRLGLPADVIRTERRRGYCLDPARLADSATPARVPLAAGKMPTWHILIADGDYAGAQALARVLRAGGQRVTTVVRGGDALAQLEALAYDLAVMDLSQLQVLGDVWLTEVRRRYPALPLVILSARPSWEDALAAQRAAADAYLVKPVSADELLAQIGRVMCRREAYRRRAGLAAAIVTAATERYPAGALSSPGHTRRPP